MERKIDYDVELEGKEKTIIGPIQYWFLRRKLKSAGAEVQKIIQWYISHTNDNFYVFIADVIKGEEEEELIDDPETLRAIFSKVSSVRIRLEETGTCLLTIKEKRGKKKDEGEYEYSTPLIKGENLEGIWSDAVTKNLINGVVEKLRYSFKELPFAIKTPKNLKALDIDLMHNPSGGMWRFFEKLFGEYLLRPEIEVEPAEPPNTLDTYLKKFPFKKVFHKLFEKLSISPDSTEINQKKVAKETWNQLPENDPLRDLPRMIS